MAPASVQMVLVQGENADGVTLDENEFATGAADDSPTVSASDRVVAAILATREDADAAGLELSSVGVAWTDQLEAAALRDALAAHKLENVMLVSAFLAATSLTQFVGGAMGYERTALLFMEPDTATLAVVETSNGSIADVHQERLNATPGRLTDDELMHVLAGLDRLPTHPDGLFVLGSGVDIAAVKAQLEEATSLSVSAPEEPETALARAAALASANASLFASSTAALAYAQDPGTGAVDASALPEYLSIAAAEPGEDDLAYSAVADDEANAPTVVMDAPAHRESGPRRRSGLLVGSVVAVAGFSAALALEVALSVGVHTTVGLLPAPLHNLIAPAEQVFAPVPAEVAATQAVAPKPLSPPAATPPPAAPVPAAPPPAAPLLPAPVAAAPPVPVPLVVPPLALPAPPRAVLPEPPVVQVPQRPSPPIDVPPPIHVPTPVHVPTPAPPKSPLPQQIPPAQGPNPGGEGGGPAGNPGGPATGPGPSHGTPGGGPAGGSGPLGGGPAGGDGPVGGPTGGGGASSGGDASAGGGTSSSSGGGGSSAGGGSSSSGGGSSSSSGGSSSGSSSSSSGGAAESGGGSHH